MSMLPVQTEARASAALSPPTLAAHSLPRRHWTGPAAASSEEVASLYPARLYPVAVKLAVQLSIKVAFEVAVW